MHLESRVCVVTGAARGIGRVMAERLLAAGAVAILSDKDEAALEAVRAVLAHPRAHCIVADVVSAADMNRLGDEAQRIAGRIDVWINNAGLARHRCIVDYTELEIDLMLDVNLKGTILGSQVALRHMAREGCGHIVNIISTAGLRGIPTETVYCATKWGVRGFTQGLREEAGPLGVRVSAVLPGGVDTDFWREAVSGRTLPRANFLRPEQVADAVVALLQMDDAVVPQELVVRAMRDRDFGA